MPVSLYTGRTGCGKTYEAVEFVVIPALMKGRTIMTNIPLQIDEIKEYINKVKPDSVPTDEQIELIDYERMSHPRFWWNELYVPNPEDSEYNPNLPVQEPIRLNWDDERKGQWAPSNDPKKGIPAHFRGKVLLIDECMNQFPAGATPAEVGAKLQVFSMHRHQVDDLGHTFEILVLAQNSKQFAKCIRDLVDQTVYHAKGAVDLPGMKGVYHTQTFIGCVSNELAENRVGAEPISTKSRKFRDEIFKCYSSATGSITGDVGTEEFTDDRARINAWWILKRFGWLPLLPLGGWLLWNTLGGFVNSPDNNDLNVIPSVDTDTSLPAPQRINSQKNMAPFERELYGQADSIRILSSGSSLINGRFRRRQYIELCGNEGCGEIHSSMLRAWVPLADCLALWGDMLFDSE